MRAVVVATPRSDHQVTWAGAFATGLRRHGVCTDVQEAPGRCDLLVLWGVRRHDAIRAQKAAGGEVCILERGYIGDRFVWTSVSFGGGLNGRGQFRGTSKDPARFNKHFGSVMQPWKNREGYGLLIGQVPGDMSLAGVDIQRWYEASAEEIVSSGYLARFRNHPVAEERGYRAPQLAGVRHLNGPLADALAGAAMVVTYNSNTAVDAVLAGVPTTAADPGSMAWDVCGHAVGELRRPDRTSWAAELAWKQWTLAEIDSGECWDRVRV